MKSQYEFHLSGWVWKDGFLVGFHQMDLEGFKTESNKYGVYAPFSLCYVPDFKRIE